jgi:serine/threonine-protein kinase RsbW
MSSINLPDSNPSSPGHHRTVPSISQGSRQVHELNACADTEYLEKVHGFLQQVWATSSDVSVTDRTMFETAVMEIAANIIEHGNEASTSCNLTLEVSPDRLDARFEDDGIAAQVNVDTVSMPGPSAERGRGMAIAKAALDVLTYERHNYINIWALSRTRTSN